MEILQAKIFIKFCYLYFSIVPETARLYVWRKMSTFFCATCKQFTRNVDKNPNRCEKGICR